MPNRNVVGDYRYGYQGDYAETDPETGMPAFELRLYDTRINRWISPDPYGQFHSPYLGMANNFISTIDSDGGYVYYYGKKITDEHFITILATAIGSETLKDYILSPNKHIHIGTVDGDPGNGYQGERLAVGALRVKKQTFLSKDLLRKVRGVSDRQASIFGDKFTLEPGRNDLAVVYIDYLNSTVDETIFHEIYAHVFLRDQGVKGVSDQHFDFAGSPTGGLDTRLNGVTIGGSNDDVEDFNYPLDRYLRQRALNQNSAIFPLQYFFTREFNIPRNTPSRTKVNCGCKN